jgi:hypothetical protein
VGVFFRREVVLRDEFGGDGCFGHGKNYAFGKMPFNQRLPLFVAMKLLKTL